MNKDQKMILKMVVLQAYQPTLPGLPGKIIIVPNYEGKLWEAIKREYISGRWRSF